MVRLRRVAASCLVLAAPLLLASCGDDQVIRVPPRPDQVERFDQRKASAIDILFVIDNSGSMQPSQEHLSENFEHFFRLIDPDPERVGEPGEVDYRIAVATTDVSSPGSAGKLYYGPGEPKILQPSDEHDVLGFFRQRVLVGTKGASREEGFRAAELAAQAAAELEDEKGKPLFLRDEAYLYIIFVSDEDDESRDEVRYFERRLRSLMGKGDEKTVIVSAIAGPTDDPLPEECIDEDGYPKARQGFRYAEMARLTGGTVGNICLENWAETLETLAYTGLGLRKRFQLKAPLLYYTDDEGNLDPNLLSETFSIEVQYPCDTPKDSPSLGERVCTNRADRCDHPDRPVIACVPPYDMGQSNGFWIEPRDNTVVFAGDAIPGPGSVVVVRYKPRDS